MIAHDRGKDLCCNSRDLLNYTAVSYSKSHDFSNHQGTPVRNGNLIRKIGRLGLRNRGFVLMTFNGKNLAIPALNNLAIPNIEVSKNWDPIALSASGLHSSRLSELHETVSFARAATSRSRLANSMRWTC